jgi:hypothetical protein
VYTLFPPYFRDKQAKLPSLSCRHREEVNTVMCLCPSQKKGDCDLQGSTRGCFSGARNIGWLSGWPVAQGHWTPRSCFLYFLGIAFQNKKA